MSFEVILYIVIILFLYYRSLRTNQQIKFILLAFFNYFCSVNLFYVFVCLERVTNKLISFFLDPQTHPEDWQVLKAERLNAKIISSTQTLQSKIDTSREILTSSIIRNKPW